MPIHTPTPTPTEPETHSADACARKVGRWLLAGWERRFVARNLQRVPSWLETHHLTLLTVPWCAAVLASGWLAAHVDLRWLTLASLAIALQYLTDLFDGAVGRARETGLVRWGYFMDHLLDFAFLCSLLFAYGLLVPAASMPWLLALFGLMGTLMASEFLAFGATGEFRISHFGVGPTELRLLLIGANQAVVALGPEALARALPFAVAAVALAGVTIVFRTQQRIWQLDMKAKRRTADGRRRLARAA
jgi:phosphatidylglycerophosphate synthase